MKSIITALDFSEFSKDELGEVLKDNNIQCKFTSKGKRISALIYENIEYRKNPTPEKLIFINKNKFSNWPFYGFCNLKNACQSNIEADPNEEETDPNGEEANKKKQPFNLRNHKF